MTECDVLVLGGGPAGSTCARRLVEHGLNVTVLDKRDFPRDKTCAGWITPQVAETCGLDLGTYAERHVCQPIYGFRTGMLRHREVETRYREPISYGIRRCEFDDYLLKASAARLRLGKAVGSIRRADGRWVVNDELAAPMLVGAGGNFCPVARRLGGEHRREASQVVAQEIEFPITAAQRDDVRIDGATPELFFADDLQGYAWCFRKGDFLNIGLGRVGEKNLSAHVQDFLEFLRETGKVACEIPSRLHGHAYRLYERTMPRLFDDGVMLVGDSAGLAYPQSGEGIRPAVESAVLAADVIAAAGRNYTAERLADYEDKIVQRLGKPRGGGCADWLPASWLSFVAARLLASKRFSRSVVMDRWFLHTQQPALASGLTAGV